MGHDPWNDHPDEDFMTTNAGNDARVVGNYDRMGRVSGHVLLNHAAVCLSRFGKPLTGTQVQRNFVQSVASSVPGQSSPLLYLEGGLFPRLFYASSSQDAIAPLGALPLFSYMDKKSARLGIYHSTYSNASHDPFVSRKQGCRILEALF